MFYVNGTPILADGGQILLRLREELAIAGIERFRDIKPSHNNIQFTCPIHAEGQERKPSCGMLIKTLADGINAGTVHCFTCGYKATLQEMISHCYGREDDGRHGAKWLIKNFVTVSIETRPVIKLNIFRREEKREIKFIAEKELDKYRYYHEYMYTRGLTDAIIEKYDIGHDPRFILENGKGQKSSYSCLTFPVRNEDGNTLFIARRSVDTKFFHYPKEAEKPVYGLYELPKYIEELVICEGILDALTCIKHGKPAVALLGTGTSYQYEQLKKLKCRKFIGGFDGDDAGERAFERLKRAIGNKKLLSYFRLPRGKDINDLTKEQFLKLSEYF